MAKDRKEKIKKLEKSIAGREKKLQEMDKSKFSKGDINLTPKKKSKNLINPVLKSKKDGTMGGRARKAPLVNEESLRKLEKNKTRRRIA